MRDSVRREIRKITALRVACPSFYPREKEFMVFRKHSGGNRYGNFLRRTFDKVREVTRRVRIVRLLPQLLARKLSRAEFLSPKIQKGNRVRNFISAR